MYCLPGMWDTKVCVSSSGPSRNLSCDGSSQKNVHPVDLCQENAVGVGCKHRHSWTVSQRQGRREPIQCSFYSESHDNPDSSPSSTPAGIPCPFVLCDSGQLRFTDTLPEWQQRSEKPKNFRLTFIHLRLQNEELSTSSQLLSPL